MKDFIIGNVRNITNIAAFRPQLFVSLKNYSRQKFMADLMAGITVGIVALPLAIAFGIASGVSPEKGIVTAILGGFIASALGGCTVQVSGPTGAFIVVVAGIVQMHGVGGLAIATAMAGVMLVAMGVFKLGSVIKFIPYPIIIGFTAGIAVTIFTTQIKDLFGLEMGSLPGDFTSKWIAYFQNFGSVNPWALLTGLITIFIILFSPKVTKKIPGSLAAIILVTLVVWAMRRWLGVDSIETIGDRFTINASIPAPHSLGITMQTINQLLPAAFTIAFLGAIESLLSATVADGVTGDKHDSNQELIGQGAANIVVPLFGGIPVTGAIARTMTNINNGGKTPVSGIIHSVVLLMVLLFLGSLTKFIPMAALAGILIVVAYNMSDIRTFRSLLSGPKSDVVVLLITFFLTVFFDLTIAIEVGLLMAMLLFMRRISASSNVSVATGELDISQGNDAGTADDVLVIPKGIEVYEINGPFFFGMASKFDESMRIVGDKPKVRIIRMRRVPFMDSTGLHNLENLLRMSAKESISIVLSGVNDDVRNMLHKAGVDKIIGSENICPHISVAMARAEELLAKSNAKNEKIKKQKENEKTTV